MAADGAIRKKILEAATRIMLESGVKKLTQPKVAEAAGVRQSHLTYYFPKRIDLVAALMQGHIDGAAETLAAIGAGASPGDMRGALDALVGDRRRMRFFLGLLIEADEDDTLRHTVDVHIRQFNALIAASFGRPADDPDVEAFLNTLRGYGLHNQVREGAPVEPDIDSLARRFGLTPIS